MKTDKVPLPVVGNAVPPAAPFGFHKDYWRSLEEQYGSPELDASFDNEFPPGAKTPPDALARRDFLTLAGASIALAGLSGCQFRPGEKILPYTKNPRDLAPGTPIHFASTMSLGGYANGLLVTAWEGRPTKVEGNPDHPVGKGATGVYEQASLLGLYDPARSQLIKQRGAGRAWKSFLGAMKERAEALKADGGAKLRFLLEPSASPLIAGLRKRILQAFPKARFHSYAPVSDDAAHRGAALAFGKALTAHPDFAKADVVLSLDADFVRPLPRQLGWAKAFADRRDPSKGELNRLYVVESNLTLTGGMADHRLRLRPSQVQAFALAVLAQLPGQQRFAAAAQRAPLEAEEAHFAAAVARDLQRTAGRSLVVVGDGQPAAVHALAHALNGALGNLGKTVTFTLPALHDVETGPASLAALAESLRAGQVDTLIVTAHNPVYASPADLDLGGALLRSPHVVYLGMHEDETTLKSEWHLPAAHPLESWGDGATAQGNVSVMQPLVQPLYAGVTEADVLGALLQEAERGTYGQLRAHWGEGAADFERNWELWLAEGLLPTPALPLESPSVDAAKVAAALTAPPAPVADALEVGFFPDYSIYDGRFGNNPWLQELPDPLTKLVWDNAVLISPTTAEQRGLKTGDLVALTLDGRTIKAGIYILPGHADGCVTLPLGYGRENAHEPVAKGVGFNAYALMRSQAPAYDAGLTLEKLPGQTHEFVTTQTHWSMSATPEREERPLALEQSLEAFHHGPGEAAHQRGPQPTMQKPVVYDGFKWAMAIDLSRCIGCNACVSACQSENNIPVVGKEQVKRGREMHWLRIDRYFRGPIHNPTMISQPVACVHCEAAPCEYVCPVNATVHSDEGLNEMVYNRCVGTRYCSNNCPYKVRRFNYLHYTANRAAVERMASNPDVTVRARGVMEKCSYCVQRIERARINTRIAGRDIEDGDIVTACQQACPTTAITFGTLSDPESRVSKLHADARRYDLLHELNTRPRTAYLVRIKNLNPELPSAQEGAAE